MAAKLSTGLRAALIGPQSLDAILAGGVIRCYSGQQPASADAPVQGTLLGSVTGGGLSFTPGSPLNGLQFVRANEYLMKRPDQSWVFKAVAAGTLGWFRLCGNAADAGGLSTSAIRLDGRIALVDSSVDAQMRTAVLQVVPGTEIPLPGFIFAFPPIASA